METTSSFGYWIRRQRKALDLTQQALADRVGCSLAAIKKIEADERRPSRQIAERLAEVLTVPMGQREMFLDVARGIRPADQLFLAHEPSTPAAILLQKQESFRHNLPMQLTSFIGREHELEEANHLLSNTRLLTLTGIGGTGKTRLALQLAADMIAMKRFANGVWLVELAPLADPTLVTQTVASTLGVREHPRSTILNALTDYVREKSILLILDNCEHLIQTCAQLADTLLRAASRLKILATSLEALGITGETVYRVPSLPLPESQHVHDLDALEKNDCVHLFVDRAMAAHPHFRLQAKNALAIAEICRRLDGIPLALELAAVRTKVFPPEEIAARLDDRFRLLTSGSRTALERHQTLFALIEWSHHLLSEPERILLRRLSVFAGGWSFEATQAACGEGLGDEVLDLLTHLVDKSLVAVEEETEEARYRLPETIRQYARDKLYESGEAEQIRDHHLEFFVGFAETAEPKLRSAEQVEWLDRLEAEHDNLRTALAWSLEKGKSDQALELVGALYYFWEYRGYFGEGQKWLDDALALSEREQKERMAAGETSTTADSDASLRAKALYAAGRFRFSTMGSPHVSRAMAEEGLRLWRELGDKWWMAVALEHVGFMLILEGDEQMARLRLEEGVTLARDVEDHWPLALCLRRLASVLMRTDVVAARRVLEEELTLARKLGDKSLVSQGLNARMTTYLFEGNLIEAVRAGEEALAEVRMTGDVGYVALLTFGLVIITSVQGDLAKARRYGSELLTLAQETKVSTAPLFVSLAFGFLAIFSGQLQRGVRLLAAAEAGLDRGGIKPSALLGPALAIYKQALEKARAQLGPAAFQAVWAEGQQMTMEQAIALAMKNEESQLSKASSSFD